jgi:hypothetical protein
MNATMIDESGSGHRVPLAIVYAIVMLNFFMQCAAAYAGSFLPDIFRTGQTLDSYGDTTQIAASYTLRPPRRLKANYLQLAIGAIGSQRETRAFVSLEPVWTLPLYRDRIFGKFGFSPTLIGGSEFAGPDMGLRPCFRSLGCWLQIDVFPRAAGEERFSRIRPARECRATVL